MILLPAKLVTWNSACHKCESKSFDEGNNNKQFEEMILKGSASIPRSSLRVS